MSPIIYGSYGVGDSYTRNLDLDLLEKSGAIRYSGVKDLTACIHSRGFNYALKKDATLFAERLASGLNFAVEGLIKMVSEAGAKQWH